MKDWFYIHKENGLCLTWTAFTDAGVPYKTLESASDRESKSWCMIDHPEQKRKKLIIWKNLANKYKKIITDEIKCDPLEYIAKQPIKDLLIIDFKAEDFYRRRLLCMKVSNLSFYVNKYTEAASWLNLVIRAEKDKLYLKEKLQLSFKQFKKEVRGIIEADKISLPVNERSFDNKINLYKEESYECLIDWKFGNKNSAKIGKSASGYDNEIAQQQIAIVRSAASKHNNYDAAQITGAVNAVFRAMGLPEVSTSTVYDIKKANKHLTISGSRGKRAYNNEMSMHVKRKRPEVPLQYFTLDGWTVELGYMDEDGKVKRLVAVIVIDVMNNYPIGYAIGERESAELIRAANRNAIIHIHQLFGEYYRPWQIQSDNFAIKSNTPFFEAVAHLHTPAAIGNAKSKVIEPFFKYLNKKYCQLQYNWTGFNIDAKKSNQVNREFSDKIKKQFPDKAGLIKQIEVMIQKDRHLKVEKYLNAWKEMPEDKKPSVLNKMDMLMIFGRPTGYTNSITGSGITPTINGKQITYDSFNPDFRALHHINWKVIYDDYDLSSILVISEDDKHRFILDEKRVIPMDVRGMDSEDHQYKTQIKQYNEAREKHIIETFINDAIVVADVFNSIQLDNESELALKGMFTYNGQQKETLQDAKGLKQIQAKQAKRDESDKEQEMNNWKAIQQQYLTSKNDFDKYLD
jgi:hypothetical protein